MPQDRSFQTQAPSANLGQSLMPSHYYDVFRRRWANFVVSFALILAAGYVAIELQPVLYLAEGKILVESQQIPSDLVRSTVTLLAYERAQNINQRVMTRENLLAVADKFDVFPELRAQSLSGEVANRMRVRTQIKPAEVLLPTHQYQMIAFTVGFEYEQPEIALKVTNEFISTILDEDIRARRDLASRTTRFLEREADKLEAELRSVDLQIAEVKRRRSVDPASARQQSEAQLAALRAELAQKSTIFSKIHPDIRALKQRIAALEETVDPTAAAGEPEAATEELERQQTSLQKRLDVTNEKLAAARLGETLEGGAQAERLEVIEQPTRPGKPARPNKPKLLAIVFGLAVMVGGGVMWVAEALDHKIHRTTDFLHIVDSQLVIGVPYIFTRADRRRKKLKAILVFWVFPIVVMAGAMAAFSAQPIDQTMSNLLAILRRD